MNICHYDQYVQENKTTKFLGLKFDSHLNWKNHIGQIIPMRPLLLLASIELLNTVYFTYFDSVRSYSKIF